MVWPTANCEALGFQRRRMAYTAKSTELHAVVLLCDARGSDEDGSRAPQRSMLSPLLRRTLHFSYGSKYLPMDPCLCRPMFVVAPRTIIQGESVKSRDGPIGDIALSIR